MLPPIPLLGVHGPLWTLPMSTAVREEVIETKGAHIFSCECVATCPCKSCDADVTKLDTRPTSDLCTAYATSCSPESTIQVGTSERLDALTVLVHLAGLEFTCPCSEDNAAILQYAASLPRIFGLGDAGSAAHRCKNKNLATLLRISTVSDL